ncbi:MAG: hypothetical protein B7O98_08210 [Zestosphaera tikiterensis]|uniref:P-type ATPase A domain-containing protein n=1 Tax=Zestosphaera tikiterensis TaxID=1973259 RepID=A0A2R7Y2R9_9CREN|nr:MAG: hypothetical protein B7O98_08210 [Zestosphaera tikiterensis]
MKVKAGEAVKRLKELQPKTVKVIRGVDEVEVPLEDLVVGDVVVVKAGDIIAVDGVVLLVSQSLCLNQVIEAP